PEDGEAGRLWDLVCRLTGELPRTRE
ncbi:MAG: hypothetical protein RLZ55_1710, partial [Actinomycetota bacterium]